MLPSSRLAFAQILASGFYLLVLLCTSIVGRPFSEPVRTGYQEQYAKTMLALSAGAYASSPSACIQRWMPNPAQWRVYTAANHSCDLLRNTCSSYTIVSEQERQLVVVFRGTKRAKQLILEGVTSLLNGKDFYGIGKVNKYFLHGLNVLWPPVHSALTDARHAGFQVTFTGHSLGGALASLGALKTVLDALRPSDSVRLYTFGQPRLGNAQFAAKHDELVPKSFRVVHRMDLVPHVPACAKDRRWHGVRSEDDSKPCDPNGSPEAPYHHGTEIWYPYGMGAEDPFFECTGQPHGEDFNCSDQLAFELTKYQTYIWDHRHYFGHKVPTWGKGGCVAEANSGNGTSSAESTSSVD